MTATELYKSDSEFLQLIAVWVAERRCPMGLVDKCLENGLDSAAECCRWASAEPDKEVWWSRGPDEEGGRCGPFPTQDNGKQKIEQQWFWTSTQPDKASHICFENLNSKVKYYSQTPTDAILHLLDNWIPAEVHV